MSDETVAIVKSSWAGWRQGLHEQMTRDFDEDALEQFTRWKESAGELDLQPEAFIDEGDSVLVQARAAGRDEPLCFRYTLRGTTIVGWDVLPGQLP